MAKVTSLWYEAKSRGRSNVVDVTLRRCRNCGEVKVLSRPCGFDHLAAIMEWQDAATQPATADPARTQEAAASAAAEGTGVEA